MIYCTEMDVETTFQFGKNMKQTKNNNTKTYNNHKTNNP